MTLPTKNLPIVKSHTLLERLLKTEGMVGCFWSTTIFLVAEVEYEIAAIRHLLDVVFGVTNKLLPCVQTSRKLNAPSGPRRLWV